MKLLLNTYVLLWWLQDQPTLYQRARASISDGKNLVFVSAAVIWEIRIKQALGKLEIPADFREVLNRQLFEMLSITVQHADTVRDLPAHHRDPFDRMLIAQARVENLSIVTRDAIFRQYHVSIIRGLNNRRKAALTSLNFEWSRHAGNSHPWLQDLRSGAPGFGLQRDHGLGR